MSKLLYIHGFASCGVGQKSTALSHYFGKDFVYAPNLPTAPNEAIIFLEYLIEQGEYGLLVGSSLGGFYATFLAEKYAMKAVLINPSTQPYKTLRSYVGIQKRFCDGEAFVFEADYLEALEALHRVPKRGDYLVLLQSGDEVLDYRQAEALYKNERVIVEHGGNHRFENLEDYLCMIGRFNDAT